MSDNRLISKQTLTAAMLGAGLFLLFGIANGNRQYISIIFIVGLLSFVYCCLAIKLFSAKALGRATVFFSIFALFEILCYLANQLISYIFFSHKFNDVSNLTVLSLTVILITSLTSLLLWRTLSRRDFLKEDEQREFNRSFLPGARIFLAFYLLVIIYFMLIKRVYSSSVRYLQPIPFDTIIEQCFYLDLTLFELFCQLAGNLFLLTPIGFFARAHVYRPGSLAARIKYQPIKRFAQRVSDFLIRHKKAVYYLLPLALSLLVEIMQYVFAVGYADIDDVILNVAGYFIGALAIRLLNFIRKTRTGGLDKDILRRVQ